MPPSLLRLNEIANIQNKVNFIIGSARTGKTSFLKVLLSKIKSKRVFIFLKDPLEWKSTVETSNHIIQYIVTQNPFETDIMKKGIPNESIVLFDDYIHLFLTKKDQLAKFQNLIYVEASHRYLTIFFGIQSTLKNDLLSYIISSNYIFLTYCTANKRFLKQFYPTLSEPYINHFATGVQQYDIALLDTRQEHLYPAFNKLLKQKLNIEESRNTSLTMFDPDTKFFVIPNEEFSLYTKDNVTDNHNHPKDYDSDNEILLGDGKSDGKQDLKRFLNDISFHGKKKLKPTTVSLTTKLLQFAKRNNILFIDEEENFYIKVPKSTVIVYLIDLINIFQSTTKNKQFMEHRNISSTLLPEFITIISFLRKKKFGASRGIISNKEVYGRLMYPKTTCSVYWKHQGCMGDHNYEKVTKISHDNNDNLINDDSND